MPDGLEWWIKTDDDGNITRKLKISLPKELFVPEEYDRALEDEDVKVLRENPSRDSFWDGAKIQRKPELAFVATKYSLIDDGEDLAEVSIPNQPQAVRCMVAGDRQVLEVGDSFYISSTHPGVIVVKGVEPRIRMEPLLIRVTKEQGGPPGG